MTIMKYPTAMAVDEAMALREPLLALVAFDGSEMLVSQIDEAVEHHILLNKAGRDSRDIDKYFRIVIDAEGADWTFVCPPDYRGIADRDRRIREFYKDGFSVLAQALQELGLMVGIQIPRRYRRHFAALGDQ